MSVDDYATQTRSALFLRALIVITKLLLFFHHPVKSNSLWPHGLQHPCPSPSPDVCPSSCQLHQWCHPAISSSDILFSFCPQQMSRLFASDDRNTGASASASVLPKNIQGWFHLGLTSLISLQSKELLSLLQHHNSKALVLHPSAFFYGPTLISVHDYWKNHSFNSIVVTVFMCF